MKDEQKNQNQKGNEKTKENVEDVFEQGAIEQRETFDTESQKEKDQKQKNKE
ncbi:hypothetical protein QUF84_20025 [Fictibacillus enclensis]|uniref:hypothetical protein n=1 Tax=Fictibacillus enclensis TaxID=1017270 RepID=UPI0025A2C63B|nr:hypothetical protein [Fictibacillus enclensis]MDM5200179.1 hypothetical protein [Fictibacillus enclensis]MDM5339491.1 hypothetical protein [Fictibacillus enclensis]